MRRTVRLVFAMVAAGTLVIAGPATPSWAAAATAPRAVGIEPGSGTTVGVGAPITIRFAGPVTDPAAAVRSVSIHSSKTPDGEFSWLSNDVLQFTPEGFWPAHSGISVTAGGAKTSFETGAALVGVADISAHTFTVSRDGETLRQMPASMGKPKYPTPIGHFSVLEKQRSVVIDSRTIGIPLSAPDGYKLTVADAVRVTWGGVYVHSAPWSVDSQGYANVSHGCINLSPSNAAWYFNLVGIGDPVIVRA